MPWLRSSRNGSAVRDHAEVVEHLVPEARVEQVEDRVLGAADVEVDRHPVVLLARIAEAARRSAGRCSAGSTSSVPAHCGIVFVSRRPGPPQRGQLVVDPAPRPRRAATRRSRSARSARPRGAGAGSSRSGHRHHAAGLAVDERDRLAPVALAGEDPVAELVGDRPPCRSPSPRGRR